MLKERRFVSLKIYLSNDILRNTKLSHEAIAAYIALRIIQSKDFDVQYVTLKYLAFVLSGSYCMNTTLYGQLSLGFQQLIDTEMITIIRNTGNDYMVNLKKLYIETGEENTSSYFTIVYLDEVHKIINMKLGKVPRFALLRYFTVLMSTISLSVDYNYAGYIVKNFVGFMPIDYLAGCSGIGSEKTVSRYNDYLEEAKLIYVYRSPDNHDKTTGQYRNKINNYGRYCDKEYIRMHAEAREVYLGNEDSEPSKHQSVKQGNSNRRLTQLYNSLVSGKMYSNDKVQQIYNHIFQKNERTLEKLKIYKVNNNFERVEQIYKNEWKDEAIFEQFPFLQRKEHSK